MMLEKHIKRVSGLFGNVAIDNGTCDATLRMGALKFLAIALVVLLLSGCSLGGSSNALKPGDVAPYTRFTLLSGEALTLSQFKGKPTVVIFWASTCTFSPKAVERLNRYIGQIGKQRANFIAASLDKAEIVDEIKAMVRLRDMDNFTHVFSGNAEYDEAYIALRGRKLPYIVIVSAEGTVAYAGSDVSAVEDYFSGR